MDDTLIYCPNCTFTATSSLAWIRHVCWAPTEGFITKDSGKREEFASGMVRDTQDDKPRYDLVDWPMIERWAALMARGAKKYGEHNWKKASGEAELARFKASALRHMVQYFRGDSDEDHGAAVFFNIAGAEMVKLKMFDQRVGDPGSL